MEDEYFSLGVGLFEINWRKNVFASQDFSNLYSARDFKDITYYTDDGWDKPVPVVGKGYAKKVKDIIPRLNLLGYNYQNLKGLLQDHVKDFPDYLKIPKVNWSDFLTLLSNLDINKIKWLQHEGDADPGEFLKRRILPIPQLKNIQKILKSSNKDDLMIFEQIDPLIILAAIAQNPNNLELDVEWRNKELLTGGLSVDEMYLIITEGRSDTKILKKALDILHPEIKDFFDFIEMNDNYPFAGAGNLSNFFRGLLKIRTNRKMIFVFDNDSAGQFEVNQLKKIKHPSNFKLFTLPEMPDFECFKTLDGSLMKNENINGRAVAIEMFLDFKYKKSTEPYVQWGPPHTSSKEKQGSLVNKETYSKLFIDIKQKDIPFYNISKLEYLLEILIQRLMQ